VRIPKGTTLVLDVSPPPLRSLAIDGSLVFDRKNIRLESDWIMVHGKLEVGSEAMPFEQQAEIVIGSNNLNDSVMGMGAMPLGVMGGTLELHGKPRLAAWTRLATTASPGQSQISLNEPVDWPVGSEIVVASTDHHGWTAGYNPSDLSKHRSERARVKAVNGNTLTLEKPLAYQHFAADAEGVPQFAEVGLLSRNIVVRSDARVNDKTSSSHQKGGHIMVMNGARARLNWVELRNLGQKAVFGRYPLHFHQLGDGGERSYLKNSSIRDSFNRCLVLHGSNKLSLENNVALATLGHCVYFEEGSEVGNVLKNNLVIGAASLPANPEERLISTDDSAAAYWITNPANTLSSNVAVESHFGFWYALPHRPIPFGRANQDLAWMDSIYPRRTPLGAFDGNVAHSIYRDGLFVDGGLKSQLCANSASRNDCKDHNKATQVDDETTTHFARQNPSKTDARGNLDNSDSSNPAVVAEFRDFVGYKNGNRGVWLRGVHHKLVNPRLADNAIGATFASNLSYLEGGTIVGETANASTRIKNQGLVGYEHYDGQVGTSGTLFKNFSGTATMTSYCGNHKTRVDTRHAAIGHLRWTSFGLTGQNFSGKVQLQNANAVNFDDPIEPCFNPASNSEDSHDGYRTGAFLDTDGSVTGVAGQTVVVKNPFLITPDCALRTEWNAYICKNLYATLSLSNEEVSPKALAGTDASAALTLTRDGASSTRLWGMPRDGLSGSNTYFEARLIANTGNSNHSYTVGFGTPNRSNKLRLAYGLRKVPGGYPAGAAGSWVRVGVPVAPGAVYIYRNYYFNEQYNKTTQVSSLAELEADSSGKVYYRNGDMVYLKLSLSADELNKASAFGANTFYHICTTPECK
jgi:cell migration-inducing and hyaluronan-binding protein